MKRGKGEVTSTQMARVDKTKKNPNKAQKFLQKPNQTSSREGVEW